MKTYYDRWANTTKNTDAVGLGCYDKSTCLVNCLDLSTIEKPWKICGSPMTFGMSTWLEKIETFSWKWLITSKHIFAYARVTGPGQFTKRLFKLYAEAGHAHQGVCLVRLHHWTISSSNIIAIVEDYSEEVEDFKSEWPSLAIFRQSLSSSAKSFNLNLYGTPVAASSPDDRSDRWRDFHRTSLDFDFG